jgi:hypothetical protein
MVEPIGRAGRRLWYEVGLALIAKTLALVALYLVFFSAPAAAPPAGEHVFGPAAQGTPR